MQMVQSVAPATSPSPSTDKPNNYLDYCEVLPGPLYRCAHEKCIGKTKTWVMISEYK